MGDHGPVMLGYIHGGTVRAEFMASVLAVLAGPHTSPLIGGVVDGSAGPLVAMARNMLVGGSWRVTWSGCGAWTPTSRSRPDPGTADGSR